MSLLTPEQLREACEELSNDTTLPSWYTSTLKTIISKNVTINDWNKLLTYVQRLAIDDHNVLSVADLLIAQIIALTEVYDSKADRDNINQEIIAKELQVKEINSVNAYTVLKLAMQTGYSIVIDNYMIALKDNTNVSIAEFKRSSSESRMDLGSDLQLKARSGDSQVLSNEIPLRLIYSGVDDNTEIKLSDGKIELLAPNNIKVTVDEAGYINLYTPKAELEVSGPDNRVNMHIEDTEDDAIYGDMTLDADGFQVLTTDGDNTNLVFIQPHSAAINNKEIVTEDVLDTEVNNLQSQIDGLNAAQNLADIVADLTALNNLSITNLKDGDKVQVLVDSNHDNASTVYKLVISGSSHSWSYIGKYGQDGYTKSEANALLAAKADLSNSNQDITANSLKAKVIGDTNAKTTYDYTSNIKMDRVENPNDSDNYAYNHLSKDLIETYWRKDGYKHSRMDVRENEASFYTSTLEDATQYMPKRASTSFFGILNYPYMTYSYYENDVNIVNDYFYLNYDGFRVDVNSNELKIDRTTNKFTYNNNEIIDEVNITNQFLTDSEMNDLIEEVYGNEYTL